MPSLVPQPLSPRAFAPFGEVIEVPAQGEGQKINADTCRRYDALAAVDVSLGRAGISIFRAAARVFPFPVTLLERHPLGAQAFMPLGEACFIIIAAPSKPADNFSAASPGASSNASPPAQVPDWENLKVFRAASGQGINFARNVWHHPLVAVGQAGDFLVVDRLANAGEPAHTNLEESPAPSGCRLEILSPR